MLYRYKVSFITMTFLLLYSGLPAQNTLPATALVEYEVLTTELQSNSQPQSIRLKINTTAAVTVNNIDINLTGNKGKLTLLYAERSETALWLLQSQENAARDNVLAWNYSDSTGILRLYPAPNSEPFVLTLEIQVNLNNKTSSEGNQQNSVMVEANLPNGMFAATATGRGNIITLNK